MAKRVTTIQKEAEEDIEEFTADLKFITGDKYRSPTSYYMNAPDILFTLKDSNSTQEYKEICDDVLELAQGRILDFGGGIGTVARVLSNRTDCYVHYYDINRYNRRFAEFAFQKHNEDVKLHASVFSVLSYRYDTVFAIDVVEHIKEYDDIVTMLYNILRMNGILAITPALSEKFRDYKTFKTYMWSIGFKEDNHTTNLLVFRRTR